MTNSKSLKKFCRLTKYIEQADPQLYQAIDDLCIGHYFKPGRESSGITFLYPADKSYRQKIVNAAYSTDPDVAVNMVKSLLVHGFYGSSKDFEGGVVNLLNQKIEVEHADEKQAKLSNGLVVKKDAKFIPMSYRENMSVYELQGKGEIALDGQSVSVERKKKTGGGFCSSSKKAHLHKLLEHKYVNELGAVDNVYAKKVRLHLKLLVESRNLSSAELSKYLGNDEFSDSYLLDMYCAEHCPSCFNTLYKALESQDSRVDNVKFEDYIATKRQILGSDSNNKNVVRDSNLLRGLRSPIEVRTKVCNEYGHNKKQLGKDLFIVFCNISKDLWMNGMNGADEFKEFAYIASKIYTKPEDLVNQEFDAARDLTLYGNLLKSDVFKYAPQADFRDASSVNLKVVTQLPSPLDMSLFSLCHLANSRAVVKRGGDPELDALLTGL